MPEYRYEARTRGGTEEKGIISAADERAAALLIREKGLWVIRLAQKKNKVKKQKPTTLKGLLSIGREKNKRRDTVFFFGELQSLLKAGLPVYEALRAMDAGAEKSAFSLLVRQIASDVRRGQSLSEAMEAAGRFSPVMVTLIRAGERGGTLEKMAGLLARYTERSYKARERLKSVLLYPAALAVLTLLTVTLMTLFVLPAFAGMLESVSADLPLPTLVLLSLSRFLRENTLAVLGVLGALVALFGALRERPRFRHRLDRLYLCLPLFGRLRLYADWRMILETLSILLGSGLTLAESLALTRKGVRSHALRAVLKRLSARVSGGQSLGQALEEEPLFPPLLLPMIASGEASGELGAMTARAADYLETRAQALSARIEALAEPAAMLVIGGVIFFFVLSVILPLLGVMDTLT